jgi:hypothetical protein
MGTPTVIPLWFGGVTGVSNTLDISTAKAVVGLITPAAWTPAFVTIEGSADGANFYMMYGGRQTSRVQFQVPPGSMVSINPDILRCCKAFRLLSGDRDNLVHQEAAREFGVVIET